ncbi:MAG: hypothetical protein BWK80_03410 [Desulfobacteraceae bacterium IS3]|nr:MAG: hypothetical protein BWK80_03410 [Desulfobacteraceae bacterium IS3]HAO21940.1 hypothetical protein [Desulfobacteraceae bacterium]
MFKKISITIFTLLLVFVLVVPVGAAKKARSKSKAKAKRSYGVGGYGDAYIGGGYKYVSLEHFGIRISKKGFYKSAGSATGTVVDPSKAGYADVFHKAQMGDRVDANYLGNGQVQVTNTRSGESATIEVRERAR